MNEYVEVDLQEAKKAFVSSIGKCEKLLSKLKENTWQKKWTQRQLDAFHISLAFIENTATSYSKEQLTEAKQTLNELVDKCKVMLEKLKEGSPQSTLAKRRLKAFLLVLSLIKS